MKRGNRKQSTKASDILISQSDFAELIGRGRAWVCRLCKRGVLSLDKSGKLFRETALAEYAAFIAQGGGKTSAPAGSSTLEGIYRELAEARLHIARLKITSQELQNENSEIKMGIQREKYALLETLKRTAAYSFAPLRASILGLVARIVWVLVNTRERAIEAQQIFEVGLRLIHLKSEMRDLAAEKKMLLAEADGVLATCHDDGARALAEKVRDIYSRMDPGLLDKLKIRTVASEGNLQPVEAPAHLDTIMDGVLMLTRDHDKPAPAPIVFRTLAGDAITLIVDSEDTAQELILGLIGAVSPSKNRSPVIAEIKAGTVRFSSRIGDAIEPPKYPDRKPAEAAR